MRLRSFKFHQLDQEMIHDAESNGFYHQKEKPSEPLFLLGAGPFFYDIPVMLIHYLRLSFFTNDKSPLIGNGTISVLVVG